MIGSPAWNYGKLIPRYMYMGELDIMGVAIGVHDDFTVGKTWDTVDQFGGNSDKSII